MKNNGNKKLIILLAILALLGIAGTAYFGVKSNQQASIAKLPTASLNSGRTNTSSGTFIGVTNETIVKKSRYYTLQFSDGQGGVTCHIYNLTPRQLEKKQFDGNHVTQVAC